jgi:hypothetical protein
VHNTICTGNAGDELKKSNLCEECFEASNPSHAHALTSALKAGCRYCGGEPYTGSGHALDCSSESMRMSFMCKACAEEYFGFLGQKLPGFGDPDATKEQKAEIRKNMRDVFAEVETHMKKWVAGRNSQ